MTSNITAELKAYCKSSGADLAGIADLEPLRGGLPVIPQNLLEPYLLAISIGIHLKNDIINGIVDCPTPEYADHYRDVNSKLDNITSAIVKWIALKVLLLRLFQLRGLQMEIICWGTFLIKRLRAWLVLDGREKAFSS